MTRRTRRQGYRRPAHAAVSAGSPGTPETPDAAVDATAGTGATSGPPTGGGQLRRAALWMAAGTAISRFTGLLRIIALAYALGINPLSDAYNLANTTPNMIYDIVLGGILAATFIPVFIDWLATRGEREAWRAISAITTAAVVVLIVMTIVFWLLAPQVIDAYTAFDHVHRGGAHLAQEKAVASTLLRWFVPQVALYGFIALMTALLNTRRRFVAPMWVPIANNVVVIGVLLWFRAVVEKASIGTVHSGDLVLLGLGTTVGVLIQATALVPALRGVGLGRLRWRWEPGHEAVRTVVRLGGWTFGFVVANQVALYVVMALAVGVTGTGKGPLSSYTYAYTFMQMPYAVVAVSIMSAVTPDLAERWSTGDSAGFRRRLTGGLRATLAVILPASMGMLILAHPAVAILLGHGHTTVAATDTTGAALALLSIGLPGFCAYLYVVRVLQAMQRTKVAFYLYLFENALNVVFAVALVGPLGVRGLAISVTIAYTAGAVAGIAILRRWLGALGGPRAWVPLRRAAGATAVMGAVVLLVSNVSGAQHGLALLGRVAAAVLAGVVVYSAIALLLGGRHRPLALLTGEPVDPSSPSATSFDRRSLGSAAGLDAAWGDTRTPVNTGPWIRIVPPPGTPESEATSDRHPDRDPDLARDRVPRPRVPRVPREPRKPEGRPVVATRIPSTPSGADAAADSAAPEPDRNDDDDPGERRWVGGTDTSLRGPLPR